MSKRTHRRKPSKGPRRRPAPRDVGNRRGGGEPDLIDDVAAALASGEPLALLEMASAFLAAVDPHRRSPLEPQQDQGIPPVGEIIETFFEVPLPETSALLAALAGLIGDDILRARTRREIAARGHVLPRWLVELHRARPHDRAVEMTEVLGDGENVALGVTLADGHELSIVVYVDHNLGTLVKDAFVVPGALAAVVERMREAAEDPDVTLAELAPADARARIAEAMDLSAITFPPIETDSWPACKPLLEWALRMFPAGGRGHVRPEWDDAGRDALAERILASPFGTGLKDRDRRELLDTLLWFGTDYAPGDPLRWSPVAVEMLLADRIPRKIVADVRYLSKAPEVLRALIRFAHAEKGIRSELTDETLDAVDAWEPEYQELIRSPRLQGPEALLASIGALDPDEYLLRDELQRAVGDAIDDFDTAPLPDEPFAWDRVPGVVRDRVAEVLPLVDGCCDQFLDVEHRTAARRLLAAAAEGDPAVFRRRSRPETTAAAVCWLVAKANRRFERGDLAVKELMGFFGPKTASASQRGSVILGRSGSTRTRPGTRTCGPLTT